MTDPLKLIAEMRARCERATKGPWWFNGYSCVFAGDAAHDNIDPVLTVTREHIEGGDTATEQGMCNLMFAEAARTDLPRLLDTAEAVFKIPQSQLADGFGHGYDDALSVVREIMAKALEGGK